MPKRAIIYTRFSPRKDADESQSCEQQRDACIRYCEQKGYTIDLRGLYFEDRAQSGKESDRDGLWSAIDALRRRDVLVVRWRHRLARDVYLSEVIKRAVKKAGARIEAAEEGNNGNSADEVFIQQVLAAFAERERKVIAQRTKHAMNRYQREGRIMSRQTPYGYRPDPLKPTMMIEDLTEQEIIQVILRLDADGLSSRKIATELDMMGYPPRNTEDWSFRTVAKIIQRSREWGIAIGESE